MTFGDVSSNIIPSQLAKRRRISRNVILTFRWRYAVRARVLTSWATRIPQIRHSDDVSTSLMRTLSFMEVILSSQKSLHGVHPSYSTHTALGVGGWLSAFGWKGRARPLVRRGRASERSSSRRRETASEGWVYIFMMYLLVRGVTTPLTRRYIIKMYSSLEEYLVSSFFIKIIFIKKINFKKIIIFKILKTDPEKA